MGALLKLTGVRSKKLHHVLLYGQAVRSALLYEKSSTIFFLFVLWVRRQELFPLHPPELVVGRWSRYPALVGVMVESLLSPAAALHSGAPPAILDTSAISPACHQNSPQCPPDRFIPRRRSGPEKIDLFAHKAANSTGVKSGDSGLNTSGDLNDADTSPAKQDYRNALKEIILSGAYSRDKILSLSSPATPPSSPASGRRSFGSSSDLPASPSGGGSSSPMKSRHRNARLIPKSPDKILDAPDIVDDYYLNLLDWSPSNVLAVALGQSVFLWNATTGATHKLVETVGNGNIITSLRWGAGNTLAVGTHCAEIQLWDVASNAVVRSLRGHVSRVASLSWASPHALSSGSRDALILNHDVRADAARTSSLEGHRQVDMCVYL